MQISRTRRSHASRRADGTGVTRNTASRQAHPCAAAGGGAIGVEARRPDDDGPAGRGRRWGLPASAASAESWITKTLARPVMRKILSSRSWLQTRRRRAVVSAHLLQATDEDAEPGGVEELDLLHVDDDVVDAAGDQLGDLVARTGAV